MHNKSYALKLIQEKINGLNNYSYSQISSLTGFTKRQSEFIIPLLFSFQHL